MVPDSIVIDGTRQGRCFLVILDGQKVFLQPVGFRFVAILGIQLVIGEDDGWVHSSVLYRPAEIVSRYIYRMKRDIYSASPRLQSWKVVENDRQGRYRLIAKPETLVIERSGIQDFGHHDLTQMVDKLPLIEKEQPSYK